MEHKMFAKQEGIWLKGNLHGHSTVSDGKLSPQKIFEGYHRRGYDFYSLTDHNIYTKYEQCQALKFYKIFSILMINHQYVQKDQALSLPT